MILSGGILRSGGNTRVIMINDTIGTWGIGIPLCLLAAFGLHWGIVGVYALLTTEEISAWPSRLSSSKSAAG